MPHRDPVLSILARCDQMRRCIAEIEGGEMPREIRRALARARPESGLAEALAVHDALESHLEVVRRRRARAEAETAERMSGLVTDCESVAAPPPRRGLPLLAVGGALAAMALIGVALCVSSEAPPRPAAKGPREPFRAYFVAVVTETRGTILAGPRDRCMVNVVALPVEGGADDCRSGILCPGIERRLHPSCEAPTEGEAFELRDPVLDIDGERESLTLVDRVGADERGRAELVIASFW